MNPLDIIGARASRGPRHRDGQPESTVEAFGMTVRIDRHAGTVIEGTGPDGNPYRVVQRVPYGYLPGVRADDGDDFDVYLGPHHTADRVYVVTQCKASSGYYDEPKGMLGFDSPEAAEECYRAHTAPSMFGRMGSMTVDAFKAQLAAWHESGAGTFRPETDEDCAECAEMDALETEMADEPPESEGPASVPEPDAQV